MLHHGPGEGTYLHPPLVNRPSPASVSVHELPDKFNSAGCAGRERQREIFGRERRKAGKREKRIKWRLREERRVKKRKRTGNEILVFTNPDKEPGT